MVPHLQRPTEASSSTKGLDDLQRTPRSRGRASPSSWPRDRPQLKIVTHNVQGCAFQCSGSGSIHPHPKLIFVSSLMRDHQIDVFLLQETWITSDQPCIDDNHLFFSMVSSLRKVRDLEAVLVFSSAPGHEAFGVCQGTRTLVMVVRLVDQLGRWTFAYRFRPPASANSNRLSLPTSTARTLSWTKNGLR